MPIDLILGDPALRGEMEQGSEVFSMEEKWLKDLNGFGEWRKPFLLYP